MLVVLCIVSILLTAMVPALANGSITKATLKDSDKVTIEDETVEIDDAITISEEDEAIEDDDEYNEVVEKKVDDLVKSFFEVDEDDEAAKETIKAVSDALKTLARKGSTADDFITPRTFYEMVAPKNAEVPEEQKQQESSDSDVDYENATTEKVAASLAGYHFSTQFASLTRPAESTNDDTITLKLKASDANENTKFLWVGKDGTIIVVEPLLGEDGKPMKDEDGNYVFVFPGEGLIAQVDLAEQAEQA
jgi:hypothetical protein